MEILFGSLIVFFILNVPLAIAVGLSCVLWMILSPGDIPNLVIAHRFVRGLDSFPLMAIPFFMMAGQFMNQGGIARRLIDFAYSLVGSFRGGLAHINIMVSMFFAGMTGSGVADTSAIGSLLIPSMRESGYKKEVAVSVTAISSVIGVIIPPSIVAVMYAIVAEISVGRLMLAGALPGIMLGLGLMGVVVVLSRKRGYPPAGKFDIKNILPSFKKSILALMTVVIVVGGIYAGVVTPTEASIICAVYSFILSKFVYRTLKWKQIPRILIDTGIVCSLGLFLLGTTSVFSWIIATQQIPQEIFNLITGITTNEVIILLGMIAVLLLVGTVLESIAAIIIMVPIIQPIALAIGLDPIHFGAIVVLSVGLGLATPPVGVCLFVACGIGDTKVTQIIGALLPFFLVALAVLLLVAFVPQISLFIPSLMM